MLRRVLVDPIPVKHGQSVSLQKVPTSQPPDTQALVSPRSDRMHGQKSGYVSVGGGSTGTCHRASTWFMSLSNCVVVPTVLLPV